MASSMSNPPGDHALSLLDDEARLVREFFAASRRCAAPDPARIAVVVGPAPEDAELCDLRQRLERAGHRVTLWHCDLDGDPEAYDVVVLRGGPSPDPRHTDPGVVAFVRRFAATGRPIVAPGEGARRLGAP
jgi:hypothetical protein